MASEEDRDIVVDLDTFVRAFDQDAALRAVTQGPEHRIAALNAAARNAVVGRDVVGRPYAEAVPEFREQGFEQLFDRVYRTGEIVDGHEWRTKLFNPGGADVELTLNLKIHPVRNAAGVVDGCAFVAYDVSADVRARETAAAEMRSLETRYEQAREVVATFQRALLPDRVPALPTVQIAAHHLLASDETFAGGDWFDVVPRDDHVILVVGDVVGHGVDAAATMGQLRAVLFDHLSAGMPISEAVVKLDARARRDGGSFGATVCIVELHPGNGDVRYVLAGHPPPLVLEGAPDGPIIERFLQPMGSGPLGATGAVVVGRDRLADGGCIVLYTDGIVELPDTAPAQGTLQFARTARWAADHRLPTMAATELLVERVTARVIESLTRRAGHTDDITLLAAQRVAGPPPLELRGPAVAEMVARARVDVAMWLQALDVRLADIEALLYAVVELTQNAVDHAYVGDRQRSVEVTLALRDDGAAVLVVRDSGTWKASPAAPDRGVGIALVRSLVDHLDITTSPEGTVATVRHRISRDAGPFRAVAAPGAPPRAVFEAWHHEAGGAVEIGARGPLDAASVGELRTHLALGSRRGRVPARLDLSEVTLLSSAGVQAILRARADNPELEIIAPPGSAVQHVLTLVAIPHVAGRAG